MSAADARTRLPLSNATFFILLALADGERHGYSIGKEVAAYSDGAVKLGPGTLYRVIKELVLDGWIAQADAPSGEDDPRRRYYRLTPVGRRIAIAEAQRLADLVKLARSRRLLPALTA